MDGADQFLHLAKLARELHAKHKFSPAQIRNRTGFLDSNDQPYIPLETIQDWLRAPSPTESPRSPAISSSHPAVLTLNPPDDTRELHAKVARLEAQLRRQSFENRRTPSPVCSLPASQGRSPARSRSGSPDASQAANQAMIDQLLQMNAQLMAQLSAVTQLVANPAGAADRTLASAAREETAKPFKDWLPQLPAFSGSERNRTPEAFLAQFYLYAHQQKVPAEERPRQLVGKLTGPAQAWYTHKFATNPDAATEAQIALGLRQTFGVEYAGVWALRAMYAVAPSPTQSGSDRLRALDESEERARQHRVPRDAGPCETRFSRVLALFLPEELKLFLGELTADPRCSEAALRQLEESSDLAAAAGGRASLAPTSPAREALFAARVQLAEAALRRVQMLPAGPPRPVPQARVAYAAGSPEDGPISSPEEDPRPVTPSPSPPPPAPATGPADYSARCCRVAAEHALHSAGNGFSGPPHYFGDNADADRKAKNQAELRRRRAAGFCFKCRMTDVKEVPFLECPLHGALASAPNARTVARSKTARASPRG